MQIIHKPNLINSKDLDDTVAKCLLRSKLNRILTI